MKKTFLVVALMSVFAIYGCSSTKTTGAIPYVCSGCQSEKAISTTEKAEHQKEIVLFMIKF